MPLHSRLQALLCCWASATVASGAPCPGNTTVGEVAAGHNLTGKVAIVTGGDSGLGFSMARALVTQGARVVIATRNLSKGELAVRELTALSPDADAHAMSLDLSSLASARAFASQFTARFGSQLHYLFNNAGIGGPSVLSKDGYELVFEVDYLGHFLLTELLLPSLRKSAPSRVINTASGAHENACESAGWPEGCFKDWTYLPPPPVPLKNVTVHYKGGAASVLSSSYGIAKFLQVQHAAELTAREEAHGVTAFSLTPGFALTGMTSKADPGSPTVKRICDAQVHPDPSLPANPCPFSSDQGAAVMAYCALEADASLAGRYFSRTWACEERPAVMHGLTPAMQASLYERSREWVGLAAQSQEQRGVTYV